MTTRERLFLDHLRAAYSAQPTVQPVAVEEPPAISLVVFRDVPEPGRLTAFTCGLSLSEHMAWIAGRVELCVSVRSDDFAWAEAIGSLASFWRGVCPFHEGDLIDFGRPKDDGSGLMDFGVPIAADSALSAFAIARPSVLDEARSVLATGDGTIFVRQAYPIHAAEKTWIGRRGWEAFLERPGLDLADVKRRDATQRAKR